MALELLSSACGLRPRLASLCFCRSSFFVDRARVRRGEPFFSGLQLMSPHYHSSTIDSSRRSYSSIQLSSIHQTRKRTRLRSEKFRKEGGLEESEETRDTLRVMLLNRESRYRVGKQVLSVR